MTTRYFGAPIARNEDRRLLTGRALFVNGVQRPGTLHVAFLRSPHAHVRLDAVDLSRVRERPGVVAAYVADDLGDYWKPGPLLVPPPPIDGTIFNQRTQVPLASGRPTAAMPCHGLAGQSSSTPSFLTRFSSSDSLKSWP